MNTALPPSALRRLAPGLLLLVALLLLFRDTAVAMVTIWNRSETFAHAFLVPPIVLWMVWRRRATLATLPAAPAPWVLLPMLMLGGLWLLAELASVAAATQFALVAMLVLSVPLVFGLPVARALTFPLMFAFFAVPVGDFMVPSMMEWTANFTVAALQFTGIPVYREGLQFVIPSGNWSVVEACSGVRYLIASFMVGTLFAYLNYRSTKRRVIFMVISLLMPVLANWLRAYLIVMMGHLSGNELAAGADHLVYGWVFFGIVIGLMFMVGARWSEPDEPVPVAADGGEGRSLAAPSASHAAWVVAVAGLLVVLAAQGANWQLNRPHAGPPPVFKLPPAAGPDWSAAAQPASGWQPFFGNSTLNASQSYAGAGGAVGVWVAYYRDQNYERKLITSTNTLVELKPEARWAQVGSGGARVALQSGPLDVRTAVLRASLGMGSTAEERLRVWQVYWVGGAWFTSDARAKLQLAFNRLLGRGDDAAAVFYYTPAESPDNTLADRRLEQFVMRHHPALAAELAQSALRR